MKNFGYLSLVGLVGAEEAASRDPHVTQIVVEKCSDPQDKDTCVVLAREYHRSAREVDYSKLEAARVLGVALGHAAERVGELRTEFREIPVDGKWASITQVPKLTPNFELEYKAIGVYRDEAEIGKLSTEGVDQSHPHLLVTSVTADHGVLHVPEKLPAIKRGAMLAKACRQPKSDCVVVISSPFDLVADPDYVCGEADAYYKSVVVDGTEMGGAKDAGVSVGQLPAGCLISTEDDVEPGEQIYLNGHGKIFAAWSRASIDDEYPHRMLDFAELADPHPDAVSGTLRSAALSTALVVASLLLGAT